MADPTFAAGETLAASKLQKLGDDSTWIPILSSTGTAPVLGSGSTSTGVVWRNGSMVTVWFEFVFGSSGSSPGSGWYRVGLPSAYPIGPLIGPHAIGQAMLRDDSAGVNHVAILGAEPAANELLIRSASSNSQIADGTPWSWAAGDSIRGSATWLT